MARFARVVVPDHPYHVTCRGNRREAVFFTDEDREVYLALLSEYAWLYGLEIWACCLMTNHVHLLVLPHGKDSLASAVGRTHMRYARWLNRRMGWSGHLWAGRFFSTVLDGEHLWEAVRYVEVNPVRARMVSRAEEYPWSSCRMHGGLDEKETVRGLLSPERPFLRWVTTQEWPDWINAGTPEPTALALRRNTSPGRPTGGPDFVERLERQLDRILKRQKTGRKPNGTGDDLPMDDLFGDVT